MINEFKTFDNSVEVLGVVVWQYCNIKQCVNFEIRGKGSEKLARNQKVWKQVREIELAFVISILTLLSYESISIIRYKCLTTENIDEFALRKFDEHNIDETVAGITLVLASKNIWKGKFWKMSILSMFTVGKSLHHTLIIQMQSEYGSKQWSLSSILLVSPQFDL